MFELSPVLLESFKVLYVVKKAFGVDRLAWAAGPWDKEPDLLKLKHNATNYICWIVRRPMGQLCGYVEVPKTHIMFEWDAAESMPPYDPSHGGVTFSDFLPGRKKKKKWSVGFDCAHYQDFMPRLEADLREAHKITEMCMGPKEFHNIAGEVKNYKTVEFVTAHLDALAGWCENVDKVSKWTRIRLQEKSVPTITPAMRRKKWIRESKEQIKVLEIANGE